VLDRDASRVLAVPLVDGGAFDWLARLAANRRAVYIATGAGAADRAPVP
jgi:hypothetical protein